MVDNLPHLFMTDLDQDLENIEILLQHDEEVNRTMEFRDYFSNLQRSHQMKYDESDQTTPISAPSTELNSTRLYDTAHRNVGHSSSEKEPMSIHILSNQSSYDIKDDFSDVFVQESITPTSSSAGFLNSLGTIDTSSLEICELHKHSTNIDPTISKMEFLGTSKSNDINKKAKLSICHTPGAVIVKECYIEPPKVSRISKSLDGKSQASQSLLNIATTSRRASEGISHAPGSVEAHDNKQSSSKVEKQASSSHQGNSKILRSDSKKLSSESTQPKPRFTTTVVAEADHKAKMDVSASQEQTKIVENV